MSKTRKRFTERLRTRWRDISNFGTTERAFGGNGGVASGGAVIDAQGFITQKPRAFDPVSRAKGVVNRVLTSKTQPTGWTVPISKYPFTDNLALRVAADLWVSDEAAALATYGHISNWDVSAVTDMKRIFEEEETFNEDISGWDTSSATRMDSMFFVCAAFNQDISGWDTSNVTDMEDMFLECIAFDQDLGGWDTSNVTDMRAMFGQCTVFNQDLGDWDTSSVTRMDNMFSDCLAFDQDLSGWDVSAVTHSSGFDNNTPGSWTSGEKPSFP